MKAITYLLLINGIAAIKSGVGQTQAAESKAPTHEDVAIQFDLDSNYKKTDTDDFERDREKSLRAF